MNSPAMARTSSPRSTGSGRSSSEPASSLERSSSSVARLVRRSICVRIWAEELGAGVGVEVLVLQQLHETAQREDGRAQLVRGGGDEALARRVQARELALHVVEGAGQLAQLVHRVDGDALREVPGRDLLGRLLQALDPQADRPRHQVAGQQRDGQRDRAGGEDLAADDLDVGQHVGEQSREDDDVGDLVPVPDGQGRLAHAPVGGGLRARDHPALAQGVVGDLEVEVDVGRRVGVRGDVGAGSLGAARDAEQGDAIAGAVGGLLDRPIQLPGAVVGAGDLDDRAGVLLRVRRQAGELLVGAAGSRAGGRRRSRRRRPRPGRSTKKRAVSRFRMERMAAALRCYSPASGSRKR